MLSYAIWHNKGIFSLQWVFWECDSAVNREACMPDFISAAQACGALEEPTAERPEVWVLEVVDRSQAEFLKFVPGWA